MASQVARGPFLLNYTGHSGSYEIGSVMSISHIDRLTFTSMPVTFFASCETTPVDAPFRGIGTKLFLHPSGPIALVGTGRDVYLNNNRTLNEEFARQISLPDGPERLGDVRRTTINLSGKTAVCSAQTISATIFLATPHCRCAALTAEPPSASVLKPVTLSLPLTHPLSALSCSTDASLGRRFDRHRI